MLHVGFATVVFNRGIALIFVALVSSSIIDTITIALGKISCSEVWCVFSFALGDSVSTLSDYSSVSFHGKKLSSLLLLLGCVVSKCLFSRLFFFID